MQNEDFNWFVANNTNLFEQYGLSYLAIHNKTVLGSYPTPRAAIEAAQKTVPMGQFIVQLCTGDDAGYTNFIASARVI